MPASPDDNTEIMSLEDLIAKFDYKRINKSPAVFDFTKLKWMNGEYLKKMDDKLFYEQALPYLKKAITKPLNLEKIAAMVKTRIEIWPDIEGMVDFFEALPEYNTDIYCHKKMKPVATAAIFEQGQLGLGGQHQADGEECQYEQRAFHDLSLMKLNAATA